MIVPRRNLEEQARILALVHAGKVRLVWNRRWRVIEVLPR